MAAFFAQACAARRQPYRPPRESCRAKFFRARALGVLYYIWLGEDGWDWVGVKKGCY